MNKQELIRDVFLKNVGIKLEESDYDKEFNSINMWDSLKHVQFIIELELELGIQLEAAELESGSSVNKIFDIINKK